MIFDMKLWNDVTVMNFSHVYENQSMLQRESYQWMDCTDLRGTNCYLEEQAKRQIRKRMEGHTWRGIHMLDSGNYHYMTKLWTDQIHEPFTLVVIDHHTDLQRSFCEGMLSCGSWVGAMLKENPYVERVIELGVGETSLAERNSLAESKEEAGVSFFSEEECKGQGIWRALSALEFGTPVYLSIDKDVLSEREAATNWDQGTMSVMELERILTYIIQKAWVMGVDICGETTMSGPFVEQQRRNEKNNRLNGELLTFLEREEQRQYEKVINY